MGATTGRTLLAVFAHPDDETFLAGPIIAKYAHEGVRVELVVATPPVGPVSTLECAAERLGISTVHYLGYAHSAMPAGRPGPRSNEHGPGGRSVPIERSVPRGLTPPGASATRSLVAGAPLDAIAGQIRQIIVDVRPQVVLTDSPYGAYGHPDHVAVHRAAVRAFHDALGAAFSGADPPSGGTTRSGAAASSPDRTSQPRLYALAFPMPLVRLNLRLLKMRGVPVAGLGPRGDIDLQGAVRSAGGKTGLVAVARYVRFRRLATECYEDEIRAAPLPLKLLERSPLWVQRLIFSRQAVTRLEPPPEDFERGLFP